MDRAGSGPSQMAICQSRRVILCPAEIKEIAEISKGTQISQKAQKWGHHRWL